MRFNALALLLACSCTTVVINQPYPDGGPQVDYPEASTEATVPPSDAAAEAAQVADADQDAWQDAGVLDSGVDASTACSHDNSWDKITCFGWVCPTAVIDIPSCNDGGWNKDGGCGCVAAGKDGGSYGYCCSF